MSGQPLISVIIPTYNREHEIRETIQSVVDQTYHRWELIVVDDGSEDNTQNVVDSFHDPRISYVRVGHTGYIGKTRNVGIKMASGEYIAFLDSDDLWRNDKLEFQLSLLQKYPEASFVFSSGSQFGEGAISPPQFEQLFIGNVFYEQLIHSRFCIYSPTLVFSSSVIQNIGMLDESVPTTRDVHFFFRMSYKFIGIFTNEHLVRIRKHKKNTSTSLGDISLSNSLAMVREFMQKRMITTRQFRKLSGRYYYTMALDQYKRGDKKLAVANFFRSNMMTPINVKGWIRLMQSVFF